MSFGGLSPVARQRNLRVIFSNALEPKTVLRAKFYWNRASRVQVEEIADKADETEKGN